MQVQTFYNRFEPQTDMILDASFSGLILFKTAEEAITIIESIASTNLRGHHGRTPTQQKKRVLELNSQDDLLARHKLLSQQIETLNQ